MTDQTPENPETPPGSMPPPGAMPTPGAVPSPGAGPVPGSVPPPPPAYPPPPPAYGSVQYGAPQYGNMPPAGMPVGMPSSAYANWGLRVVSAIIDGVVPGVLVGIGVLIDGGSSSYDPTSGVTTRSAPGAIYWLLVLAAAAFGIWNSIILQGRTGQSLGKRAMGTTCLKESTMQPLGPGMQFARQVAHILDNICYVGYLWPIWDKKRQTFADKIVGTVVVPKPKA